MRIARTVTALRVTNSIVDFSAKALKSQATSETKLLPKLAAGTLMQFFSSEKSQYSWHLESRKSCLRLPVHTRR